MTHDFCGQKNDTVGIKHVGEQESEGSKAGEGRIILQGHVFLVQVLGHSCVAVHEYLQKLNKYLK